jgi:hypothetical protein
LQKIFGSGTNLPTTELAPLSLLLLKRCGFAGGAVTSGKMPG